MDTTAIRSRIVAHRIVAASALRPHPLNWRTHPDSQRTALHAVLDEIGLARSVLAYVADADKGKGDDAPLTLIDGHLRRDELGDGPVTVEVLDLSDEEARKLLLSLDSLAALAGTDDAALAELLDATEADSQALALLWQGLLPPAADEAPPADAADEPAPPRQFLVVVHCRDEKHQEDVLAQARKNRWKAKAATG